MKYYTATTTTTASVLLIGVVVAAFVPPVSAFSRNSNLHRAATALIESSKIVIASSDSARLVRQQKLQSASFLTAAKIPLDSYCNIAAANPNSPRSLTILDATVLSEDQATSATTDENAAKNATTTTTLKAGAVAEKKDVTVTATLTVTSPKPGTIELLEKEDKLLQQMEAQAVQIVEEMMDETCEVNLDTGAPLDDICVDEEKKRGFRDTLKGYIKQIGSLVVGRGGDDSDVEAAVVAAAEDKPKKTLTGDALEKGCK